MPIRKRSQQSGHVNREHKTVQSCHTLTAMHPSTCTNWLAKTSCLQLSRLQRCGSIGTRQTTTWHQPHTTPTVIRPAPSLQALLSTRYDWQRLLCRAQQSRSVAIMTDIYMSHMLNINQCLYTPCMPHIMCFLCRLLKQGQRSAHATCLMLGRGQAGALTSMHCSPSWSCICGP